MYIAIHKLCAYEWKEINTKDLENLEFSNSL